MIEFSDYPTKSAQDLLIEDLRRENDAALEKIEQLSRALVDLGFDPTQLPDSPETISDDGEDWSSPGWDE
jgi:hypothetical protein